MKYIKPNGTEVDINDSEDNIKAAENLGWKPAKEFKPEVKKVEKKAK